MRVLVRMVEEANLEAVLLRRHPMAHIRVSGLITDY